MGTGDFEGTFYTHNKVPRVVYKANATGMNIDNFISTPRIAGAPDTTGGGTTAQPNAPYYENKDRTGTNHSYIKFNTVDVSRDWLIVP